jgi:hypothetical protein
MASFLHKLLRKMRQIRESPSEIFGWSPVGSDVANGIR